MSARGVKMMNTKAYGQLKNKAASAIGALFAAVLLIVTASAPAGAGFSEIDEKVKDVLAGDWGWGKISFNVRWRFEYVDQQGKDISRGDSIRLRLGYLTPKWLEFQGFTEFEGSTPIFLNDYNSLRNGKTRYAVIADPADAELNQGWLAFSGIPDTVVKAGRQKIVYNNHRFIGNVGWRQMEQTFDAAGIVNRTLGNSDFKFAFVRNVRTITSQNVNMASPLLNLGYTFPGIGKLSAYGYWLDYDDDRNSGPFSFAFSTQTYGIRFNGSTSVVENLNLFYTAEYAYQADYKNNPGNYNANYFHFIGGIKIPKAGAGFSDITAKTGWEYLGSDNGIGLQTPLGTNHAFLGWADQFLVTPPDGVVDLYGALGATFWGVNLLGVYHQFDAAEGSEDYGHEIDAQVTKKFGEHYSLMAKYANYFANDFKTDTWKFWLQAVISF